MAWSFVDAIHSKARFASSNAAGNLFSGESLYSSEKIVVCIEDARSLSH